MVQNWRNYAAYYVIPYIGQRDVQEINGAVCDALYAKLLAEGRVKAKPKKPSSTQAVHTRRLAPDGREMPCRPYSYDTVRCYRKHAANDPLIGEPIKSKKLGRRACDSTARRHSCRADTAFPDHPARAYVREQLGCWTASLAWL